MARKKVMHIISDENFGGAGRYVLEICKYINMEKFEIVIVMPIGSILKEYIGQNSDIEIIEIYGVNTRPVNLRAIRELYSIIKEIGPDIVHTHACMSARIAASIAGVEKRVYTRHSLLFLRANWIKHVNLLINGFLSNKAIAVSKAVYNNLIETGEHQENIRLIHNGVSKAVVGFDKNKLREKYKLSSDNTIISLIGRLETVKGQENLIEIAKVLKEKVEGFQILLAGEGSKRFELESKIRETGLPIRLLGHVEEIEEIYFLSDIIVNTSNSEAISFAILEALSFKKPIVAFDIGGIKEVIDDGLGGYLVEFKDYDAFADKLVRLINDEFLRESFGQAGYKKVRREFSVEKMINEIEKLYLEG